MKTGIVTIYDLNNYGNRLQNYATITYLRKRQCRVKTVPSTPRYYSDNFYHIFKHSVAKCVMRFCHQTYWRRFRNFDDYTQKYIPTLFSFYDPVTRLKKKSSNWDYMFVGSDQVWNPNFQQLNDRTLLSFFDGKKIAFSASFGVDDIPTESYNCVGEALNCFTAISVREESGKTLVEKLTGRTDVEVLVDPTMLLDVVEWDKTIKRPEKCPSSKFILCYFLGILNENRKEEIERIAKQQQCEIVYLMDQNTLYYTYGPSEFLWAIKNAALVCTDSFHGTVFSILYDKTVIVFDREDQNTDMGSRLKTLLGKFQLENCLFHGKITDSQLEHDYANAYVILEMERQKAERFIKKALDLNE